MLSALAIAACSLHLSQRTVQHAENKSNHTYYGIKYHYPHSVHATPNANQYYTRAYQPVTANVTCVETYHPLEVQEHLHRVFQQKWSFLSAVAHKNISWFPTFLSYLHSVPLLFAVSFYFVSQMPEDPCVPVQN